MMNGDDGGVVASDDPRLTALELAEPDAGSEMKRYRLKVNFLGFADTQFLKDSLRRSETLHG